MSFRGNYFLCCCFLYTHAYAIQKLEPLDLAPEGGGLVEPFICISKVLWVDSRLKLITGSYITMRHVSYIR